MRTAALALAPLRHRPPPASSPPPSALLRASASSPQPSAAPCSATPRPQRRLHSSSSSSPHPALGAGPRLLSVAQRSPLLRHPQAPAAPPQLLSSPGTSALRLALLSADGRPRLLSGVSAAQRLLYSTASAPDHVGCIRNRGHQLTCCPEGCWFCSRKCSKIFQHLQELIGKSIPTPVEGLSCTILRFDRENASDHDDYDNEKVARLPRASGIVGLTVVDLMRRFVKTDNGEYTGLTIFFMVFIAANLAMIFCTMGLNLEPTYPTADRISN